MTNSVTYDGVTLVKPRVGQAGYSPNLHLPVTCFFVAAGDISTLKAKYAKVTETMLESGLVALDGPGSIGSLVWVHGGTTDTFENVMISSFSVQNNENSTIQNIELVFVQDTHL